MSRCALLKESTGCTTNSPSSSTNCCMISGGPMVVRDASVWITGAGSGIGLAFSRDFLKRGAKVLAIDRNAESLAELEKEAKVSKSPLGTLVADVTAGADFISALEGAVKAHG